MPVSKIPDYIKIAYSLNINRKARLPYGENEHCSASFCLYILSLIIPVVNKKLKKDKKVFTNLFLYCIIINVADVAQSVEYILGKDGVGSSNLLISSKKNEVKTSFFFILFSYKLLTARAQMLRRCNFQETPHDLHCPVRLLFPCLHKAILPHLQ